MYLLARCGETRVSCAGKEATLIGELMTFGAVGILEGASLIPLFRWASRSVGKALGAERGPLRRTASTAVASLAAFSLDLLPLTYAATTLFPADRSPDLSLRGEIWIGSWLGALALSAVVLFIKRRHAT